VDALVFFVMGVGFFKTVNSLKFSVTAMILAVPQKGFSAHMSRKFKKGYFVQGQFVAEGSELDLELKRELKGGSDEPSRTELKRESDELQKLGESLLILRADLMAKVDLPDKLVEAVAEAKRITNFEGKRRQMQFIGKLMRKLDEEAVEAVRAALLEQSQGSAQETLQLHLAEQWRDRLISDDSACGEWLQSFPGTDSQQLRALIRQARKDAPASSAATVSQGLAPRQSRAFREIFQLVRSELGNAQEDKVDAADLDEDN
jgi:ribosome-associated protein